MSTQLISNWNKVILENNITKTFLELSEEQWTPIRSACRRWYCGVCACKIKKGKKVINKVLKGPDLITDWQEDIVLACIAGPIVETAEIVLETL